MANHTITILGINKDGSLNLSDGGTTTALPGDTITWVIGDGSGVASITGIVDNSQIDVFSPDPAPVSPTSWKGTINPTQIPAAETEMYTINYTKVGSAKVFAMDPEIEVKPKP